MTAAGVSRGMQSPVRYNDLYYVSVVNVNGYTERVKYSCQGGRGKTSGEWTSDS